MTQIFIEPKYMETVQGQIEDGLDTLMEAGRLLVELGYPPDPMFGNLLTAIRHGNEAKRLIDQLLVPPLPPDQTSVFPQYNDKPAPTEELTPVTEKLEEELTELQREIAEPPAAWLQYLGPD